MAMTDEQLTQLIRKLRQFERYEIIILRASEILNSSEIKLFLWYATRCKKYNTVDTTNTIIMKALNISEPTFYKAKKKLINEKFIRSHDIYFNDKKAYSEVTVPEITSEDFWISELNGDNYQF